MSTCILLTVTWHETDIIVQDMCRMATMSPFFRCWTHAAIQTTNEWSGCRWMIARIFFIKRWLSFHMFSFYFKNVTASISGALLFTFWHGKNYPWLSLTLIFWHSILSIKWCLLPIPRSSPNDLFMVLWGWIVLGVPTPVQAFSFIACRIKTH